MRVAVGFWFGVVAMGLGFWGKLRVWFLRTSRNKKRYEAQGRDPYPFGIGYKEILMG